MGEDSGGCGYNCTQELSFSQRLYILDFAGGGAVHMLGMCVGVCVVGPLPPASPPAPVTTGGIAGLIICLFAKLQEYRDRHLQVPIR